MRTFFGSLPTTPLPKADCCTACDKTTVAGLSIGCSSRETSFSLWPRSLTRSVINLLDCASLPAAAGTTLVGPASALMTGAAGSQSTNQTARDQKLLPFPLPPTRIPPIAITAKRRRGGGASS